MYTSAMDLSIFILIYITDVRFSVYFIIKSCQLILVNVLLRKFSFNCADKHRGSL